MSIFITDQGQFEIDQIGADFLKGTITLSKVGVYDYYVDGKMVKKAKLPEDLFSAATRASADLAPITDGHPLDADGQPMLVKPDNYKQLVRGTIGKPWVDGLFLRAPAIVYDAQLQKEIKSGEKKEASIGFLTEDDDTPGSYQSETFDSAQRDIRVNHAALVKAGRAGPEARFHVDMKEDVMLKFRTDEGKELTIDGADASSIHGLLTTLKQERDEAKKKLEGDSGGAEVEKLQKQIDELQTKLDADKADDVKKLEKDLKDANDKLETANDAKKKAEDELKKAADGKPAEIQKLVAARAKLEGDAKDAGIEAFDGLGDRQVMEQIIAKHMPYKEGVNVDEKSDAAITDRYEAIVDMLHAQANEKGAGQVGKPVVTADAVQAKRSMIGDWHAKREAERQAAGK